jgi:hypothetical protein
LLSAALGIPLGPNGVCVVPPIDGFITPCPGLPASATPDQVRAQLDACASDSKVLVGVMAYSRTVCAPVPPVTAAGVRR